MKWKINHGTMAVSAALATTILLSGCGGSGGGSNSGGPTPATTGVVSIDAMTTVPVINGSATKGTLYIHNYSNKPASGLSFSLDKQTTTSKVSQLLAKVGLSSTKAVVAGNGFTLNNPELCASIPAGGSCAINFTTPGLTLADRGNSLVTLNYKLDGNALTTNQVVNYQYAGLDSSNGVNFTGRLNVSGKQGTTQHVVGYLYGSGTAGSKYSNVKLNSTSSTTVISGGFINGQEVAAGQVIAVEYSVALQNSKTSYVNITPSWSDTVVQSTKKAAKKSTQAQAAVATGNALALTLTPAQNTVNLIFGQVPILTAPTTSAASISVTNNGNAAASSGVTATSSNAGLTIDDSGCSSTSLAANAANSCNISFSVSGYTPGSATVTFSQGGNTVGTQIVIWTNDTPVPAVYIQPSTTETSVGKGNTTPTISFTVSNIGKAPLQTATFTPTDTGPATWNPDNSGSCMSSGSAVTTLAPNASCTISGTLTGTNDGTGNLYYTVAGSYNSVNYNFVSLPLAYEVTAAPSLSITPTGVSMTLLANGESTVIQVFTVQNIGNDPALFSSLGLTDNSPTTVNPAIVTYTGGLGPQCAANTELAETSICYVQVQYGPAAANRIANETGSADLYINYHGGTPDTPRNVSDSFDYNLVGNDSVVTVGEPTGTNLSGNGTSATPFSGNSGLDPMTITINYSDPSLNYPLGNFNLNTNNLPTGLTVDGSSTCPTGSSVADIAIGGSCNLVLKLDRSILATNAQSGSVTLDFTEPTASWTTPLGFYSQSGSTVYLTYSQPVITFSLSQNSGNFATTDLTMTATNLVGSTLNGNVGGVKNWLETVPTTASSNCTVDGTSYAVNCSLNTTTTSGTITYTMPTYLQPGEKADIPLLFSTDANQYAALSPGYTFINYQP